MIIYPNGRETGIFIDCRLVAFTSYSMYPSNPASQTSEYAQKTVVGTVLRNQNDTLVLGINVLEMASVCFNQLKTKEIDKAEMGMDFCRN